MTSSLSRRLADRSRAFVAAALRRVSDSAHRAADRLAPSAPSAARPTAVSTAEALGLAFNMVAAMTPLPPPPVPTGNDDTDEHNLRLFQTALAQHAKHDDRLRTVGALLSTIAR